MVILVTGGAGFIGSNFLNLVVPRHPEHTFVNFDALTYAANLENLAEISQHPNYQFFQGDLCSVDDLARVFAKYHPDAVVHFAAESHVDRSILGPGAFVQTNIVGTYNLLEAIRAKGGVKFVHVSTDEVYGSLGETGYFTEETAYDPSSPYSASKASSDHLVRAYHRTFGLDTRITNCSNNYGPYQFPEKLIPLMVLNATEGKPLPVYGEGLNIRDWLFVTDHCEALWLVLSNGKSGETYNIGGQNEIRNIDIVKTICRQVGERLGRSDLESLITYVADRPGHDFRYAIDSSKIQAELGWQPKIKVEDGLRQTVDWYLENPKWVDNVRSGAYRTWIESNYGQRA